LVHPLKLVAAAAIAAAPVPALAEPAMATLSSGTAVAAVEAPKEASKAQPVALKDKGGLHHAVFHPRLVPALPKVQRTGEAETDTPEFEVPEKDFEAVKPGFRIAGSKLQFRQFF
jgi:hypothetical protein